jgi:hypothetical protein
MKILNLLDLLILYLFIYISLIDIPNEFNDTNLKDKIKFNHLMIKNKRTWFKEFNSI